jgi:hypothetical protein
VVSLRVAPLISSEQSNWLLDLSNQGLDSGAAGRRISAMTEEEKNALTMYVGMCGGGIGLFTLFFQCEPQQQPHGSGTGGAVAVAQLGSVRLFPPRVCYLLYLPHFTPTGWVSVSTKSPRYPRG